MRDILVPGTGRPYLDGDALDHGGPLAWTVPDVLTADECHALIDRIEALGPQAAPVSTPGGFKMMPDVRNNTRVMFDDEALAAKVYARVSPSLPPRLAGLQAHGANERFRCYRYEPGQQFALHRDGAFVRDEHERSELTLMVYLNDTFTGGHTTFNAYDRAAAPRTGMALLFQHYLLHEGATVTSGIKYVLRSDVMYRAV